MSCRLGRRRSEGGGDDVVPNELSSEPLSPGAASLEREAQVVGLVGVQELGDRDGYSRSPPQRCSWRSGAGSRVTGSFGGGAEFQDPVSFEGSLTGI